MPQMTPAQARVIDPVLTQVARGYQNAAMAGMALFPYVGVGQRGGKVIQFGKEHFRLYATARAPGGQVARLTSAHSSLTYALEQHAIAEGVPYELMDDAGAVPGIDLGMAAVRRGQDVIALRLEKAQADLATNAASYAAANKVTLSGTTQWSHASSLPLNDVETAKEAIRASIGVRPNTMLVSGQVFSKLKTNPTITDRIKYTSRDVATPELMAALFGVERFVVADAIYMAADGTIADVWGKFAVLAYTATGGIADAGRPSFGYTYRLNGHPLVEEPYQDRDTRSWVYQTIDEVSPVLAGAEAGYLFSAAVA